MKKDNRKVQERMRGTAKDILTGKISVVDASIKLIDMGETTASISTGLKYWGIKL